MILLLLTILNSLLSLLAKMTPKDRFISPMLSDKAKIFVEGFDMDEH